MSMGFELVNCCSRVYVEHITHLIKLFRIIGTVYRHTRQNLASIDKLCAGLAVRMTRLFLSNDIAATLIAVGRLYKLQSKHTSNSGFDQTFMPCSGYILFPAEQRVGYQISWVDLQREVNCP